MPWVEHHERGNEPEAISRHHGDDEGIEELVLENVANVEAVFHLLLNGNDGDIDSSER